MIVKILGIFDILVRVSFWISTIFHIIPENFLLILALFLLAKGIAFLISLNIISLVDIVCALLIILSFSFTFPLLIPILVSLFLIQKGIFSLIA